MPLLLAIAGSYKTTMITARGVQLQLRFDRIIRAVELGSVVGLSRGAYLVYRQIQALIEIHGGRPAYPGRPVHSRAGRGIFAIQYAKNAAKQYAVIGPRYSRMGAVLSAHEFGKRWMGISYARRPTMGPALKKTLKKLPGTFSGVVRSY